MLVFMIIVIVLIGVAYADLCLIDNTAHFGICFGRAVEAEESAAARRLAEITAAERHVDEVQEEEPVTVPPAPDAAVDEQREVPLRPPRSPAPAWLLWDLEPVLELREG